MVRLLSHKFKKYAKGWLIFFLLVIDVFFMSYLLPTVGASITRNSTSAVPIDLMFFYTPQTVYKLIAEYGDAARETYRSIALTIDIEHQVVYTLLFSLLITWLFQKGYDSKSKMQKYNVVPMGAFAADLLENFGIITMLSIHPSTPAIVAWLTTFFTMTKWLFVSASIALVIIGVIALASKELRQNRRSHRHSNSRHSDKSSQDTTKRS